MDKEQEPLRAQSVEYWTLDELMRRSMQAFRKRLGLPPTEDTIEEADHASNNNSANSEVTSDQPIGIVTKKAEEK